MLSSWLCCHTILPRPSPSTSELTWICQVSCRGNGLLWYSLPHLFFWCTVCPAGSLHTLRKLKELALVFFSTFKPITLTPDAVTQRNGMPIMMLYDTARSSNLRSLYLCLARNVLGRLPLTPCFVRGKRIPTLPHSFGNRARELWLTAVLELATAAGFMRSTFGCGVTTGVRPGQPRRVTVA